MKKLLFFFKSFLETFWFVPCLIIMFSILMALGLVYADSLVTIPNEGWGHIFFVNNADSARTILSTISGAMIGVAGTVFSVTLVALTLASSQFGPRLIKNFMYVRLNQVVLGSYISTYLYCLIVLNAIKGTDDYNFIPSLSILIAILVAIANIILLIVFIHQIAMSIQADNVISDISTFMSKQVETLFPEKMGDEIDDDVDFDVDKSIALYQKLIILKSPNSGYLQYIDSETITRMVISFDSLLFLEKRPGNYVVKGESLGSLHLNIDLEDEEYQNMLNQFIIGNTKTSQQDLEFSIHQMVEIAVRALSPGVNDPYTAIACIDNLSSTMSYLAQAQFPSKYRFDKEKKLRVIANKLDFEGMLNAAFNQIRQFSQGSAAVIIRLMEALITIKEFTNDAGHEKALIRHAEMVLSMGERTIDEANDLEDLKLRSEKIIAK